MKTLQKLAGSHLEAHIINGSANLKYNWEQFCSLTADQKRDWIWFAFVRLNLNETKEYLTIGEDTYKEYFTMIQNAKRPFERSQKELDINGVKVSTAAQAMTLMAYGDSSVGEQAKIPFRNLHFLAQCEDYKDFITCIRLINSYNDFDASLIAKKCLWDLGLTKYYNENNPNNGSSFFKFEIGRESSPVFYVEYNPTWDKKVIKDTEGAMIYWEEYTAEDFKHNMECLKTAIKADEFSIEEGYSLKARFWFD